MAGRHGRGGFVERIAVEMAFRSGLSRVAACWSAGRGAIFMFHSVVPDRSAYLALDLRASAGFLDRLLAHLRSSDIDIVSIGEVAGRLARPTKKRFVVLTFDDGYADNLTCALPVFEKHRAPMTVYVTTDMVRGHLWCWWIGLERLFQSHSVVEIEPMETRFVAHDRMAKQRAYLDSCRWVGEDIQTRAPLLTPVFRRYGVSIDGVTKEIGLTKEQLRSLARSPLVTIGGHTDTHPEIARLSPDAAREEIVGNKRFLEEAIDQPVVHFAYPFGGATACGRRDAGLVGQAGFLSAVTTTHGCVFDRHAAEPYLLPRVGVLRRYESIGLARVQMDGLVAAIKGLNRAA